jgi:hypothetical protein
MLETNVNPQKMTTYEIATELDRVSTVIDQLSIAYGNTLGDKV